MSSRNHNDLTPAEISDLDDLETTLRHGLAEYEEVGDALAEIRDRRLYRATHDSFEDYLRERWDIAASGGASQILARVCELTLAALDSEELAGVDVQLTVRKRRNIADEQDQPTVSVNLEDDELIPRLRWLMAQATGTIGELAYGLERSAADLDDKRRAQLRDDLLVLDEELAIAKALLIAPENWDGELQRLLEGEIPPFEDPTDHDDL